jgi:hypothetical protein
MTQAGGVSREAYLANKTEIRSCSVLRFTLHDSRDTNDEKRGARKMLTGAGQKQPRRLPWGRSHWPFVCAVSLERPCNLRVWKELGRGGECGTGVADL